MANSKPTLTQHLQNPLQDRLNMIHSLPSSKYSLSWDNWAAFQAWLLREESTFTIKFHLVNTYQGLPEFERQCRYVCSRRGTGGSKPYTKLHPDWNRKRGPKRTECKCALLVKQYPGTATILGNYSSAHDHLLRNANLPFTQIPKDKKEHIAGPLQLGVSADHIDCNTLFDQDSTRVAERTEFIELRDI
ncbi:hypothetical protein B0H17DRAFT_1141552 [Mycena rosella]|uniref:FAR1 domain-containing protein n=1 Tax=Mycena rosella TaxID=1033263 RepID=A0AAD7G6J5_MYCRO|nr:hypothetical protein B0H17DRAFT_1141552 [Mycena rosella]